MDSDGIEIEDVRDLRVTTIIKYSVGFENIKVIYVTMCSCNQKTELSLRIKLKDCLLFDCTKTSVFLLGAQSIWFSLWVLGMNTTCILVG